jgi:hypothetical protein
VWFARSIRPGEKRQLTRQQAGKKVDTHCELCQRTSNKASRHIVMLKAATRASMAQYAFSPKAPFALAYQENSFVKQRDWLFEPESSCYLYDHTTHHKIEICLLMLNRSIAGWLEQLHKSHGPELACMSELVQCSHSLFTK